MNLQQLRHFVAVAEERHFSRAAARLGMAQPPLSQSIARLEAAVGFRLLNRSRRGVELTPGGEVFLREARDALRHLDQAVSIGRRVAQGELRALSIGFVAAALAAIVPRMLRELRRIAPECKVSLHKLSTEPQRHALRDGEIDIGLMFPDPLEDPEISTCPIETSRMVLAIPTAWPLGKGRRDLSLADISGEPLILFSREQRPDFHAALLAECRRRGFEPRIVQDSPDLYTTFSLVAAELGIGLTYETSTGSKFPGVRFLPLADVGDHLRLRVSMAWLSQPATPGLSKIIDALVAHFAIAGS